MKNSKEPGNSVPIKNQYEVCAYILLVQKYIRQPQTFTKKANYILQ